MGHKKTDYAMLLGTLWGSQKSVASKNILGTTPPKSQIKNGPKMALGARVWGQIRASTPQKQHYKRKTP